MSKKETNRQLLKRLLLLCTVAALVIAFKVSGFGQYMSFEYIKASREEFAAFYAGNSALVIMLYMLVYIVVTALSLPGAAVMTLLGGALFGFTVGLVIVSFASTIGATLAFVVSRFLLRDWVQGRFGQRLSAINRGLEAEGAFYLFTLRLIPVFPFFVINLLMGLTRMRVWTFYWVSQVGMLAGTMVYVNAGKELGRLQSASGIFSPGIIMSFVLLGLFPITVKKIMGAVRKNAPKSD